MSGSAGYAGFQDLTSTGSDINAHGFLIAQAMARIATSTVVKVVAVTNSGGVSPVGFVDVQPLVNQVDGAGNATPHGVIHNLPYARIQGGANAIIIDPQVGDIGYAGFASRDISAVKANKAQANPGSSRRMDWADGVYLFGILNGTPTQYVQFTSSGVTIVSPQTVTITAPNVAINASTAVTITSPTVTVSGDVVADGTSLHTHKHGGVTTGGGDTGVPL